LDGIRIEITIEVLNKKGTRLQCKENSRPRPIFLKKIILIYKFILFVF